jgi:hypothetical protein
VKERFIIDEGTTMNQARSWQPGRRIAAAMLAVATITPAFAQSESGFLKDYSQLAVQKDVKGAERRIWVNDKVNWSRYERILVDPVVFHPQPEGTAQVTLGTLFDIRDYLNAGVPKAAAASMPLAAAAGPGVVRLRAAITAVSVDKSLKAYQILPIALIFTAAKRSAGTESYNVKLQLEAEMLDSTSGEVLARVVREAKGIEVTGDEPVTMKTARPQLDLWLAAFKEELALRARKPAP